ncbi:MAG: tRNA (pseudouridine(54)-N(1))-methyltransferase TrmY [Candidatus Hodarchaeota archaeon]
MKRIFVVKSGTAHTIPDFSIKDIPGTSGRLDVVCRCLISAFGKKREKQNTDFYGLLEGEPLPPRLIAVEGRRLQRLPDDEFEVAKIMSQLLGKPSEVEKVLDEWPGISICPKNFNRITDELKGEGALFYLHQKGQDIRDFDFPRDNHLVFVMGDHMGLGKADENVLRGLGAIQISVGPLTYLASQCITLVHEELDWKL